MEKKKRAFTLVELLIIIVIIGIIASFIMISVAGSRAKSRDTKRAADLGLLDNAINFYYREKGHYPSLPENCGANISDYGWINAISSAEAAHWINPTARANCLKTDFIPGIVPRFINTLPIDPGPFYSGYADGLSSRGLIYLHSLPSGRECYKIILFSPENRNDPRYKNLWDPARDGGPNNNVIDGTNISAWAYYSPGCANR